MSGFRRLVGEVHRRSLWQVLGIYLAGSWVALQVVETLSESMTLPEWVQPLALILLVVGLPVVLATAFIQEGVKAAPAAPAESLGPSSAPPRDAPSASPEGSPAPPSAAASGAGRRLFTWRNAGLGGIGALAVLGLALGGWLATRALGIGPAATLVAQGVLGDRATLLVANFESSDENLARVATEAFKIDLSQSRVVELAQPAFVRQALARMERDPDAPLDRRLALELALREGIPAVLQGEIAEAGGRYVVSAQLVSPEDGAPLASHRETASDSSGIVSAIDATSRRIRERIGESLATLRAAPPLARVTTANLEALRRYSQAVELSDAGDDDRAIALLEEAVALDTAFAMAYRKLGVILQARFEEPARQRDALTRAFAHRDRLTERERYLTMAAYYTAVEGDLDRAAAAYESLIDLDPDDDWALNNVGIIYGFLQRDFARGEALFRRAMAIDSLSRPVHNNLVDILVDQGKVDEARQALETWRRLIPNDPQPIEFAGGIAFYTGEYELAEARAGELLDEFGSRAIWRATGTEMLGLAAGVRGRLEEADGLLRETERIQLERGLRPSALGEATLRVALRIAAGDREGALALLREALATYPLAEMAPPDRPYERLITLLFELDRPVEARAQLEAWEAAMPEGVRSRVTSRVRGMVLAAEGDIESAMVELRRGDRGGCLLCALHPIALAWDRAGVADSAIVAYETYLDTPWLFRRFWDAGRRGPSLERLGQLYDEKGDLENAAKYYAAFVELWAEADEELQPRVRAAQARLEEILGERG